MNILQFFAMSVVSLMMFTHSFALEQGVSVYGDESCIEITSPRVKKGSLKADILIVQNFLVSKGLLSSHYVTGVYGEETTKAVKLYQISKNISSNGIVGPLTKTMMTAESCLPKDFSVTQAGISQMTQKASVVTLPASALSPAKPSSNPCPTTPGFSYNPVTNICSYSTPTSSSSLPVSAPTVTLTSSKTATAYGGSVALSWSSAGATSCKFIEGDSQFTTYENTLNGTNRQTQSLYTTKTFTLSCTGKGGTTEKSVTITVAPKSTPSNPCPTTPGFSYNPVTNICSYSAPTSSLHDANQMSGNVLGATARCMNLSLDMVTLESTDKSSHGEVSKIQDFLASKGLYSGPITGYYGSVTRDAVKMYQISRNIPATGNTGLVTKNAINEDSCSTTYLFN